MIMTTLLHTSITFRTLFPSRRRRRPVPVLCARCRRVRRFVRPAFSLSPHCVRRYDDPILHLYSTVRDSSRAEHASARVPRSVLPNERERERVRGGSGVTTRRARARTQPARLHFFLFNARFGRMRRVNLVALAFNIL